MRKALCLLTLLVLVGGATPVHSGPLGDRCAAAFQAVEDLKQRIWELQQVKGDHYDLQIAEFQIMVLRSIMRYPKEVIRNACSV